MTLITNKSRRKKIVMSVVRTKKNGWFGPKKTYVISHNTSSNIIKWTNTCKNHRTTKNTKSKSTIIK